MEYVMQQKMSKQIEEYESSRIIEIENIKQQYEMWLKQKDTAMQQMVEGLNKYRAKKAQQLRMCEQEIIVLYEYTMKIESILKMRRKECIQSHSETLEQSCPRQDC